MKVRLRHVKLGKVRWTSHRDAARMWERAFRRLSLPVAWSGGFAPRPKVSFGLALPTGAESVAEYLDLDLLEDAEIDLVSLPALLSGVLPAGIDVTAAGRLDSRSGSLQQEVTACTWHLVIEDEGEGTGAVSDAVSAALAADALVVTRERKGHQVTDDLRPAIRSLTVLGPTSDGGVALEAELATQPRGVRPAELALALDAGQLTSVRRLHQWIERDGARWEPLLPAATDAPHAMERAS